MQQWKSILGYHKFRTDWPFKCYFVRYNRLPALDLLRDSGKMNFLIYLDIVSSSRESPSAIDARNLFWSGNCKHNFFVGSTQDRYFNYENKKHLKTVILLLLTLLRQGRLLIRGRVFNNIGALLEPEIFRFSFRHCLICLSTLLG